MEHTEYHNEEYIVGVTGYSYLISNIIGFASFNGEIEILEYLLKNLKNLDIEYLSKELLFKNKHDPIP